MQFNQLTTTAKEIPPATQELLPVAQLTDAVVKECNLENQEEASIYLPYGREYAKRHNIQIALNFLESTRLRESGVMALTLRELDTAARGQMDLSNPLLRSCLLTNEYSIVEGILGEKNSGYDLRALYNRMVKYKKEKWHTFNEQRKEDARKKMADVLTRLSRAGIPAWKEEIEHGFHADLCKPEFMTGEQYLRECKRIVKLLPSNEDLDGTSSVEQESELEGQVVA